MYTFLLIFHVIVSLFLILVVLLQRGKGSEMGAAFGGASQTLFGSYGPTNFLGKLTTAAAVVFMITSLVLSSMSSKKGSESLILDLEGEQTVAEQTLPPEQSQSENEGIVNTLPLEREPVQTQPAEELPVEGK